MWPLRFIILPNLETTESKKNTPLMAQWPFSASTRWSPLSQSPFKDLIFSAGCGRARPASKEHSPWLLSSSYRNPQSKNAGSHSRGLRPTVSERNMQESVIFAWPHAFAYTHYLSLSSQLQYLLRSSRLKETVRRETLKGLASWIHSRHTHTHTWNIHVPWHADVRFRGTETVTRSDFNHLSAQF